MPVLVAIDGSWHSDAALRMAARISLLHQEPLTVLTVVKAKTEQGPLPRDEIVSRISAMDLSGVPDVQAKVRYGHPAANIVREAEEGNYALVVVGARQQWHSVGRRLLGSTAIRVAEHAPGPVIVAKGPIRPIRQILLCDSGSMDPAVGLPSSSSGTCLPGAEIPSVLGRFTELPLRLLNGAGEIVVMHVMSQMSAGPGVQGKQLRSNTEDLIKDGAPEGKLMGRDIEALQRMGLRARAKVSRGLVVEEILEEAQRGDYDLVVIGAYRGQGWQRILLEDLAHRIVAGLDRSVLVVR